MTDEQPTFRVLRGTPTAEELAALVGAVLIRSRPALRPPLEPSVWAYRARPGAVTSNGVPTRIGPGGWRSSALPH